MPNKRIFVTGGSGYVGSVLVAKAVEGGYLVDVLSRTVSSDDKIRALGAAPIRGDLKSHDVLCEQSTRADMVLHLAHMGNVGIDYAEVLSVEKAAVNAITYGLKGSNKSLVVTSATLVVQPTGAETTEESPLAEKPLNDRFMAERHALSLNGRGFQVSVIRLPPYVYGRGGSGVARFMGMFASSGEAFYVDGGVKTSAVHVDDAAVLFLLAAEKACAGEIINAVSDRVTTRELCKAIGSILDLPAKSLSYEDIAARFSPFLARLLSTESQASGIKARVQLGWEPNKPGIIQDIAYGSYLAVAASLKTPMT